MDGSFLPTSGLRPRSRQVARLLDAIELLSVGGVPPSLDELGAEVGLTKSGVHRHLSAARKLGLVAWSPNRPRSVRLLAEPDAFESLPTRTLQDMRRRIDMVLAERGQP